MKIAINIWILRTKQVDGIGNFTIESLRPLIQSHPEIEFQLLCDKNFTEDYFDFPNVTKYKIFPPYRHPILYFIYMEWVVKRFLKKHQPALFLSMEGFLCLNTTCKQLPIIYDLNFEHQPQDLPFRNRFYFRNFYPKFARKGKRVITISEYSKQDIHKTYNVDSNLIDNVSCGVKQKFQPIAANQKITIRSQYTDGKNYFFFIGSMHPRKNIVKLIIAFDIFKKKTNSDFKLVLAGNVQWNNENIQSTLHHISCKNDIVFPGRIDDDMLNKLLGSAYALTFVPTFEGFGLPIVEAFQCEVPVICSNTTSMPEVAGDAALLVNPFDENDIALKMQLLFDNPDLVESLVEKGKLQKQLFTWNRTAQLMYQSIEKSINGL